ncbi:hypothetical protein HGP05_03805 [Streptococcus sanguinis]|uniref:Uncharacterized protein n=1 Tax=Streptococcus sanguinis TaxID=1305 RepID=A0A7Y0VB95_STRSA|nr:hypothetical protein [Streptococcus sanguinis]
MEIALWTLLDKLFLAHSDRVAGNILENQAVGSNDDIIANGPPLRITVLAPIQQLAPILTGATVKSIFSIW